MATYSFTTPRTKKLLETNTKVWLGIYFLSLVILVAFSLFLVFTRSNMVTYKGDYAALKEERIQQIQALEKLFVEQKKKVDFAESVKNDNAILAESIKNLFELIPDQITISSVRMEQKKLIIKGITPSKDIYEFLLAAPLKSIFNESDATFYRSPNGWYNFVSTNEIDAGGAVFE